MNVFCFEIRDKMLCVVAWMFLVQICVTGLFGMTKAAEGEVLGARKAYARIEELSEWDQVINHSNCLTIKTASAKMQSASILNKSETKNYRLIYLQLVEKRPPATLENDIKKTIDMYFSDSKLSCSVGLIVEWRDNLNEKNMTLEESNELFQKAHLFANNSFLLGINPAVTGMKNDNLQDAKHFAHNQLGTSYQKFQEIYWLIEKVNSEVKKANFNHLSELIHSQTLILAIVVLNQSIFEIDLCSINPKIIQGKALQLDKLVIYTPHATVDPFLMKRAKIKTLVIHSNMWTESLRSIFKTHNFCLGKSQMQIGFKEPSNNKVMVVMDVTIKNWKIKAFSINVEPTEPQDSIELPSADSYWTSIALPAIMHLNTILGLDWATMRNGQIYAHYNHGKQQMELQEFLNSPEVKLLKKEELMFEAGQNVSKHLNDAIKKRSDLPAAIKCFQSNFGSFKNQRNSMPHSTPLFASNLKAYQKALIDLSKHFDFDPSVRPAILTQYEVEHFHLLERALVCAQEETDDMVRLLESLYPSNTAIDCAPGEDNDLSSKHTQQETNPHSG
ncbi:hypothetical protein NEHOM01_2128 [Nematocida homosporus]|uniref:uncharacterized protein n=1 Tax=Nematocida homosporus TaxID=1912981 RepID=UPI00221FB591|nr:uncharacterized protein NEHOM01_2128 [Nematocida homosporus]KAI5187374.1 hypothetical protein NEHOM01_2128 [Nematocida homosporus]